MIFNKKQYFFSASFVMLLVITIFIFTSTVCAQEKGSEGEKYPTKAIDVIVAYSAGGGTDTGARLLKPYLEKELGVPINIINITGAGGWVGWTELIKSNPDGYTIGFVNTPSFTTGYANPEFKRDPDSLDKIVPIANHVQDTAAWAVLANSPFDSVGDIFEYAKENPGTLSITTTGPYSQHHMMALDVNELGYEIVIIHTAGAGEATTMVLGGHVDILSASVGELKRLADEGTVKILAVADTERHQFLPEIPTFKEEKKLVSQFIKHIS